RLTITGAALVILSGIGIGVAQALGSAGTTSNSGNLPPATTKVVKTTLMETKRVPGTLDYGDPVPIKAAGPRTLTWIAPVGSTVKRGGTLFKVDEQPIVALYGSVPLYRSLSVGEKGTDVRQLKQNLSDLGYSGFSVNDSYDWRIAGAVRRWQASLGLAQTG